MRIAYLSETRLPSRTASVVHVLKMCEALAGLGHDVTLFYATNGSVQFEELCKSYSIRQKFEIKGVHRARIRGLVYIYGVRIGVLAWWSKAELALCRNLLGCVVGALMGIPVIYEAHMSTKEKGFVSHTLLTFLARLNNFKGMVVITEALKKHYEDNYQLNNRKIVVMPDAAPVVENAFLDTTTVGRDDASGKLQVGYVGQLYVGRGVDILVEVARRCEWVHMHIVGGEPEDVKYWQGLCTDISNITFYGHVDYSKTGSYRQMCDVLVAPYQRVVKTAGNGSDTSSWMSPLKIFEYMASKRAIVCSDLPALREVLVHEKNSLLCVCDSISDWIDNLQKLKHDRALRERLAENAYKDYLFNYTWDGRAERLIGKFVGSKNDGGCRSAQQNV